MKIDEVSDIATIRTVFLEFRCLIPCLLDLCAFNATCGEESGRTVARHDFDRAYMEAERTLLPGRESLRDVVNRF